MGIVKEQRKQIENLERRVNYWKQVSNSRAERARRAEAALAAGEKMLAILVKRLGGKAEIADSEWKSSMTVLGRYDEENGITEYSLKE